MIVVSCDSCNKKYTVNPANISSVKNRMVCKECGHLTPLDHYIDEPPSQQAPAPEQRHANLDRTKVSWKNRLQIKVNSVLVLLIVVIMGSFMAVNYVTEKKKMDTELEISSLNVAKRLSVYLVESFWSLDDVILQESLKSEMMNRNIFAINLFDRGGEKIYLGYARNDAWQLEKNDKDIKENGLITATETIIKDGKTIGKVEVFFTPKFFDKEFSLSMYRSIITSFLLLVAVTFAVSTVLNRMILSPILRLTNVADQISVGELDVTIPIESNDEIGLLAEAFTRMKVSMVYAIKQLRIVK